jgi:integrase
VGQLLIGIDQPIAGVVNSAMGATLKGLQLLVVFLWLKREVNDRSPKNPQGLNLHCRVRILVIAKRRLLMIRKENSRSKREKNNFESIARQLLEMKSARVSQQFKNELLVGMALYVFSSIGGFELSEITLQHLLPLFQSIEKSRGTEFAHRICSVCSEVFTHGIVAGTCERNLAILVRDGLSRRDHARITCPLDRDQFIVLIRKINEFSGSPITGAALRLSLLLLVMPGELCRAEWNGLHWDEGMWRYQLPVGVRARGGLESHYVPLSVQALSIFRDLSGAATITTHK